VAALCGAVTQLEYGCKTDGRLAGQQGKRPTTQSVSRAQCLSPSQRALAQHDAAIDQSRAGRQAGREREEAPACASPEQRPAFNSSTRLRAGVLSCRSSALICISTAHDHCMSRSCCCPATASQPIPWPACLVTQQQRTRASGGRERGRGRGCVCVRAVQLRRTDVLG
jgi:hypothetical protein